MEKKREDPMEVRVRLYRNALAQLKKVNEAKEREAEKAKEAEAETAKEPQEPGSDRAHAAAHERSDEG